ncbi:hypothetical protein ACFLIM_39940 [Nonomuraea sp. M3C6]|uniref:ABM domain-containing protein n=1 Tax=Nonomuraea marmarensis TaxID=3351344 RepID=A0ABW7APT7_9ACTN
MTRTVELTRFRVSPDNAERLLAARPGMLAGFLAARLVRLPGDEWLDIVAWRSSEDRADSGAKGANLPGIRAFFELIDELVSAEDGTTEESER